MLTAKLHHSSGTGYTVLRFQRTRFVIDAGMDDPAVVSRLMARNRGLFIENGKMSRRLLAYDLKSRGQANDFAADDNEIYLSINSMIEHVTKNNNRQMV